VLFRSEPPSIIIPKNLTATVSTPLQLQTTVRDDGLPKPRPPKPVRATSGGAFGAQVNSSPAAQRGLTLRWIQYGGPGKATFESSDPAPVTNGRTSTTVRFTEPGTYSLRAIANDGALSTTTDVIVTVK